MKVDLHPSSQSFPVYMRSPDCRRGKMCVFHAVWIRRVFRSRNALWVACMRLLSGSMNWRQFVIGCLFIKGMFTLM